MHQPEASVTIGDDGVRHLMVRDPTSGITIHVGMPEEPAKEMAELLIGSPITVVPATALGANGVVH